MTIDLQTLINAFEDTDLSGHCEDIEIALEYYTGSSDAVDFIEWYKETYVDSAEVIYYHKAMEYLSEHDDSLSDSMQLAHDLGCEPSSINSELLATLLLQDRLHDEILSLESNLEDYFGSKEDEAGEAA